MKLILTKHALLSFLLTMLCYLAIGQGVTTSSMNGKITDENGEALIGANILAVHLPSGATYGNSTNLDGLYRIANMRVGGPYKITVSYTGYEDFIKENVYLRLGQSFKFDTRLQESAYTLDDVVVLAVRNDIFDGNRTGAETTVTSEQINTLPTLSRSVGDFARLTPQASVSESSDGYSISINGMNNRYNAIYIDGAVNNDVFGLSRSGTNGGQTGVSPFSLDAIEEFQISVAPFDVRQGGFAGGSINAITKSGSNNVEGTAYYLFRNDGLVRETLDDADIAEFDAKVYGASLGGPIIKDKLFFFVNAEIQREETPLPFDFGDYDGDSDAAALGNLVSKLNGYGYDPGPYDDSKAFLDSEKITAKFDWNINQDHKLTLRHSYVHGENLEAVQSNNRTINFLNASEFFDTKTNTTSLELSSLLSPTIANNLKIGYTAVRDDRDPFGDPFPFVEIADGAGTIFFGSEQFSTANALDQDIFTISDNIEFYKGKHTITIGTHNEFYKVYNLFIPFNFGSYEFLSLNDFMNDVAPDDYIRSYSLRDNVTGDGSLAGVEFNSAQFGLYVQDEFQISNDFKLTGGIRVDVPTFDETPLNQSFNDETIPKLEEFYDLKGAKTGEFIKTQFLVSPRLGFNWDLTGEQRTQLRGGIGVFTSRVPLVWPGGAYNNNGLNRGTVFGADEFIPQWDRQPPGDINPNEAEPSGDVDLFAENFKLPQVLKFNIALDHKLPWGMIGNVDFIYNKTLNNVVYRNVNLRPSTESLEGTGDTRPIYNRRDEIDDTYGRIIWADNTNEGFTYNISASVTKPFDNGFTGMIAYSYGMAKTIFDGTSSQNSSQWRGLNTIRGRNIDQPLAVSDFAAGHRVIGAFSYRHDWNEAKNAGTTISLFWESLQGNPYSYIYDSGNLTNEDSRERSLIYVPRDQNDIVLVDDVGGAGTAAEQWAALDAFINADDYLKDRRGQYAERNASRAPFSNIMDLKIMQDFSMMIGEKRHSFAISFDIFNFGNLLNEDWGRRPFVLSQFEVLNFEGFQDGTNIPTFTFPGVDDNDPSSGFFDDAGLSSSRWQMQVGLRYRFK